MLTNGKLETGKLLLFAEIFTLIPVLSEGLLIHFLIRDVTLSTNLLDESHGMSFDRTSVFDLMSCRTRLQSPCCTPGFASAVK